MRSGVSFVILFFIAMLSNAQRDSISKSLRILLEMAAGHVTGDGKWLSYTDGNTGDLFVKEISTGKSDKITIGPGDWSEYPIVYKFSHRGTRVAYLWDKGWEIRVASLPDGATQVITSDADLFDWSIDDESLLIQRAAIGVFKNLN